MFLVLSIPNALDTGAAQIAPRYIGEDAERALAEARYVWTQEDSCFVSAVMVFQMTRSFRYRLNDSIGRENKPARTIVCVMWKNGDRIAENFYHEFERFKKAGGVYEPTSHQAV